MKNNNKKILIITGAGASFDSIDIDAFGANREWQPPLTKDLFFSNGIPAHMNNKNNILSKFSHVATIGMAYKTQEGRLSFEEFLSKQKNSSSKTLRNQFWAVPLYLQELFSNISKNYLPNPTASNYSLLLREIIESGKYAKIIWLNLNYDLFADYAIENVMIGDLKKIENFTDIRTLDGIKILYTKPHGSINWFKLHEASGEQMSTHAILNNPEKIPDNFEEELSKKIHLNCNQKAYTHYPYPAILAPLGEYEYLCKEHMEEIRKEMVELDDFLSIGFNALDKDILSFLKDCKAQFNRGLIIGKDLENSREICDRLSPHIKIDRGLLSEVGFTKFLKIGGLANWIKNN